MSDLPLRIEHLPGTTVGARVLKLDGPLTLSNCFDFQNLVRSDNETNLILDLSAVPYVDSAGIGCLMNGYVSHQNAGRTLWLVGLVDRVRAALRVSNVEQFFPIFASIGEAEQSAAKR